MNILEESFTSLFLDKEFIYSPSVKYSRAFKDFNANIRLKRNLLEIRLSHQWRGISKDIKIGLVQSLLLNIFKKNLLNDDINNSNNIDLYNNFIRNVHIAIPKTKSHPVLSDSFNRVNNEYFDGLMNCPNLVLSNGINRLGCYAYGSDTISITKKLLSCNQNLLDYVMYHEMLHKKFKFSNKNNRNYHHSPAFREKEKQFKNSDILESELKKLVFKNRLKKSFKFW